MLADGHYVDGSWILTVHIDALNIEKKVRVQGDWSVAEVIFELTDGLKAPPPKQHKLSDISLRSGTPRNDWSSHGLWWPTRKKWLLQNRVSLNQYGLQADALLRLVPFYGSLCIQLPDLQFRQFVDVNYSDPIFRITVAICRQLNIRHPEELSLAHPLSQSDLKRTRYVGTITDHRRAGNTLRNPTTFQRSATVGHGPTRRLSNHTNIVTEPTRGEVNGVIHSNASSENGVGPRRSSAVNGRLFGPPCVRDRRPMSLISTNWNHLMKNQTLSSMNFIPASLHNLAFEFRSFGDSTLSNSPVVGIAEAFTTRSLVHPANFTQRLRLHTVWLDSSKSLMELGIEVHPGWDQLNNTRNNSLPPLVETKPALDQAIPTLRLLYKYGLYYDLNPKYDAVRINQLYEQAKWSILSEVIETTDDEACLLAALQAQVEISTEKEEQERDMQSNHLDSIGKQDGFNAIEDDEIKPSVFQGQSMKLPPQLPRDISPIGGFLRHSHDPRRTSERTRPVSIAELDAEIDAILGELAGAGDEDLMSLAGRTRRSRPRMRSHRPISYLSTAGLDNELLDPGPPELSGYMKVCKPRRFGVKIFSNLFVATDGLKLLVYKTEEDYNSKTEAVEVIYLPGCEVIPDLCVSSKRYSIRLSVPISRTNLPLSAAFNVNAFGDSRGHDEEIGIGGRLRRRASLLSLTSLSQFGQSFGIQPVGNGAGGGNGLCGAAASALGLVNEIVFRLPDSESYADWLAFFRLVAAIPGMAGQFGEDQIDWNGTVPKSEWIPMLTRSTYDAERKAIADLIRLISKQNAISDAVDNSIQSNLLQARLERRLSDFLPMRLTGLKNLVRIKDSRGRDAIDSYANKSATLQTGVSNGHALPSTPIDELTSLQTKLKYISAWEQLPQHGIAFFPARLEVTLPRSSLFPEDPDNPQPKQIGGVPWSLDGGNVTVSCSRRLEAVGIGPTRVLRCDLQTGEVMASWRLSSIQGWHINWELGELVLLLASPPHPATARLERQRSISPVEQVPDAAGRVIIRPEGMSVRILAEFLGGYTFLNLRSPEKNQGLDEGVFYKLTTGSSLPVTSEVIVRG